MSRGAAVFLHIHKTAGTTLNQIIARQYAPGALVDLYGSHEKFEAFERLPDDRKSRVELIRGHLGFGIHELMPIPVTYFTLLRDPVEQTISQYYFLKSTLAHRRKLGLVDDATHHKISTMTLEEFIADDVGDRYDNPQTRALAGSRGRIFDGSVTAEVLESALRNLREWFPVVGFVEEFERSLLTLKRFYGWRSVYFIVKNPTADRPERVALDPGLVEQIRSMIGFDIQLYEETRRLLDRRERQGKPVSDEEVRRFQAANASWRGRVGFAASTAISKAQRLLYQAVTLGRRGPIG